MKQSDDKLLQHHKNEINSVNTMTTMHSMKLENILLYLTLTYNYFANETSR